MTRGIIYTTPTGGKYAFSRIDGYALGAPTASQKQDMDGCWWAVEVDDYETTLCTLQQVLAPMRIEGFLDEYHIHPHRAKDLLKLLAGKPVAPNGDIHASETTQECESDEPRSYGGLTLAEIADEKVFLKRDIKRFKVDAEELMRQGDSEQAERLMETVETLEDRLWEIGFQEKCLRSDLNV